VRIGFQVRFSPTGGSRNKRHSAQLRMLSSSTGILSLPRNVKSAMHAHRTLFSFFGGPIVIGDPHPGSPNWVIYFLVWLREAHILCARTIVKSRLKGAHPSNEVEAVGDLGKYDRGSIGVRHEETASAGCVFSFPFSSAFVEPNRCLRVILGGPALATEVTTC
jgi:hypothetical protein